MIDEIKLKQLLKDIIGWSGIGQRPDVRKMLLINLEEAMTSEKDEKVKSK